MTTLAEKLKEMPDQKGNGDLFMPEGSDPYYGQKYMPSGQELRAYQPTWRDRLGSWFMGDERTSPERNRLMEGLIGSRGLGETGPSAVDFTPAGIPLGVNDAWHKGDDRSLAMALIPGAPKGVALAENAAKNYFVRGDFKPISQFDTSQLADKAGIHFYETAHKPDAEQAAKWYGPNVGKYEVNGTISDVTLPKMGKGDSYFIAKERAASRAASQGHAGIRIRDPEGNYQETVVFNPNHIVPAAAEPPPGIRAYYGSPHEPNGIEVYHASPYEFPAERLVRYPDGRTEYVVGAPNALPDIPAGAESVKDFPLGRFRLDKVGSGEGAQAFGHGIYQAESPEVSGPGGEYYNLFKASHGKAHSYKSVIPAHPDDFLDWDKPLSQQSEKVRGAVAPLISQRQSELMAERAALIKSAEQNTDYASKLRAIRLRREGAPEIDTAEQLLGHIASDYKKQASAASAKLRDAGIPGIKYLDAGSRTAGEGSRNYVVVDDKIIDIVEKYGIAAAASMYGLDAVNQAMGAANGDGRLLPPVDH